MTNEIVVLTNFASSQQIEEFEQEAQRIETSGDSLVRQ
jgi:hypothetical protein